MVSSIDTPTLEQRVAELEARVRQLEIDQKTSEAFVADLRSRVGYGGRNCPKCKRQMNVPPGVPCPVCGYSTR